jgi:hypothetical protein
LAERSFEQAFGCFLEVFSLLRKANTSTVGDSLQISKETLFYDNGLSGRSLMGLRDIRSGVSSVHHVIKSTGIFYS